MLWGGYVECFGVELWGGYVYAVGGYVDAVG